MRFLQVVSTGHRRKGVDKPPKGELRFRQMTAQPNAKLQPQTALETASYNLHIVANLRISFGQANPQGMIFSAKERIRIFRARALIPVCGPAGWNEGTGAEKRRLAEKNIRHLF